MLESYNDPELSDLENREVSYNLFRLHQRGLIRDEEIQLKILNSFYDSFYARVKSGEFTSLDKIKPNDGLMEELFDLPQHYLEMKLGLADESIVNSEELEISFRRLLRAVRSFFPNEASDVLGFIAEKFQERGLDWQRWPEELKNYSSGKPTALLDDEIWDGMDEFQELKSLSKENIVGLCEKFSQIDHQDFFQNKRVLAWFAMKALEKIPEQLPEHLLEPILRALVEAPVFEHLNFPTVLLIENFKRIDLLLAVLKKLPKEKVKKWLRAIMLSSELESAIFALGLNSFLYREDEEPADVILNLISDVGHLNDFRVGGLLVQYSAQIEDDNRIELLGLTSGVAMRMGYRRLSDTTVGRMLKKIMPEIEEIEYGGKEVNNRIKKIFELTGVFDLPEAQWRNEIAGMLLDLLSEESDLESEEAATIIQAVVKRVQAQVGESQTYKIFCDLLWRVPAVFRAVEALDLPDFSADDVRSEVEGTVKQTKLS